MSALIQIGQCPNDGSLLDFTPINFVSEIIASLALRLKDTPPSCLKYHISNPHPRVTYAEFAAMLTKMGFAMTQSNLDEVVSLLTDSATELQSVSLSLDLKETIGGINRVKISFEESVKILGLFCSLCDLN
jgi:hypothetical protein